MTARRTTVRIDPRPWLSLGLFYPLHVDDKTHITITFDGIGSATYNHKGTRRVVFTNDAEVIAYCPEIRALAVKVMRDQARKLERAITVLDK